MSHEIVGCQRQLLPKRVELAIKSGITCAPTNYITQYSSKQLSFPNFTRLKHILEGEDTFWTYYLDLMIFNLGNHYSYPAM